MRTSGIYRQALAQREVQMKEHEIIKKKSRRKRSFERTGHGSKTSFPISARTAQSNGSRAEVSKHLFDSSPLTSCEDLRIGLEHAVRAISCLTHFESRKRPTQILSRTTLPMKEITPYYLNQNCFAVESFQKEKGRS